MEEVEARKRTAGCQSGIANGKMKFRPVISLEPSGLRLRAGQRLQIQLYDPAILPMIRHPEQCGIDRLRLKMFK
jgi:hypothetical protein